MPLGGGFTTVNAEFTPEMLEAVDGFAAHAGVSRSEAIRTLVGLAFAEAGLEVF